MAIVWPFLAIFFANYIKIFHKTEIQMVILRCLVVDILLDSTRSTEILSWKKNFERVESSKIQKWQSLDSLEFMALFWASSEYSSSVFEWAL